MPQKIWSIKQYCSATYKEFACAYDQNSLAIATNAIQRNQVNLKKNIPMKHQIFVGRLRQR